MYDVCLENEDGTREYKIVFLALDKIWIKCTQIESWGRGNLYFSRKIANNKVVWEPDDWTEELIGLTLKLQNHIDKLVKLRVFL